MIYLSNWIIEINKNKRIVQGIVVPECFDKSDSLYINRMKSQLYNCKKREFPASHENIKVIKVDLIRPIQGL